MITFTVWKSGHQYKGFECAGHAGYAEEGSDIICAAVSALAVNTINAIEQFTEDSFEVEEAEDGGLLRIRFSEVPDEKTQLLMDSLVLGIGNIEAEYGNEYITINVSKYKYSIYPRSFFQVNTDMINKLYDKVLEYVGTSKTLTDLYCGAGTIGIYLAKNFDTVKGIEINKAAIDSANLNKKINNINNISFECKNANEISNISSDVVVVDPPRSGLDKKTINTLLNSSSKKIVYVSCDPITLARDLNILKERYELKNITLFDMFPNTRHIETVCNLDRKN